ncbi:DUF4865 family protein [Streptomyces sp. CA-111067]|uniref:DUF4865 family protein n=1 Tax=Streptomyces sp. CA-111067 TaxID=3240046 RepID=UPI003D98655A
MYAMQYAMTLPADYDLPHLRERVGAAMHTLDDLPGLGLKAYLFRERGVAGSPVNEYACFYLWDDTRAMADFLFTGSGRFQNIIRAFGRPAVDHWTGIAALPGPARGTAPRMATRQIRTLGPGPGPGPGFDDDGLALASLVQRELAELRALAGRAGVHTAALALDPRGWRLVRFVLWQDGVPAEEAGGDRYDMLHVSAPGVAELPDGLGR